MTEAAGVRSPLTASWPIGGRFLSLLRNRRSLYLRWLLVFEPRVTLTTVPYRVSAS
jgi:hypothetical protein